VSGPVAGRGRRTRREFGVAIGGAVVAGGLALSAAGQTWARLTAVRRPPLPPVTDQLSGGQVAPLVTATGLLLLAAAVALVAVRGAGRVAVGLLMAVAGGALAWSGLRPLVGRLGVDSGSLSSVGGSPDVVVSTDVRVAWPVLALAAGILGILAGVLVVLRGRTWPAMGRRYERPGPAGAPQDAARTATAEDRASAAWRALDRGEDPTEPAATRPAAPPAGPRAGPPAGAEA
jgi:uncharacterized membrane protein (TIGR02234 family)